MVNNFLWPVLGQCCVLRWLPMSVNKSWGLLSTGQIHLHTTVFRFFYFYTSTLFLMHSKVVLLHTLCLFFRDMGSRERLNQYVCCKFEILLHNTNTVSFLSIQSLGGNKKWQNVNKRHIQNAYTGEENCSNFNFVTRRIANVKSCN